MYCKKRLKSILFSFLFIFVSAFGKPLSLQSIIQEALEKQLYTHVAWQSLLHLKSDSTSYISDPTFLLSHEDFSSENELRKTLEYFFINPQNICQFPARFLWLSHHLPFDSAIFNLNTCKSFQNYLSAMPLDTVKLVFATEEISSLSSMMGHTFFKLEPHNPKDNITQKAITFYPKIQTNNIPSLAINSTLFELKGNFIIQDYEKQEWEYLQQENRNIWEYTLRLNTYQKKLMVYHFWELSHTNLPYNFIHYNCGTLMNMILNIALENQDTHLNLWVTPKDVVARVHTQNLITHTQLTPSKRWELHKNTYHISESLQKEIVHAVDAQNTQALTQLLLTNEQNASSFALAYVEYIYYKTTQKNSKEYQELKESIHSIQKRKTPLFSYKNPVESPYDTQISLIKNSKDSSIYLDILPTTHTLYDNNEEYFGESHLKIAHLRLALDEKIKIDDFILFSMKTLLPYDAYSKSLSKEIEISYTKHYDKYLNSFHSYNHFMALGQTYELHPNILSYFLLGLGVGYGQDKLYAYANQEVGVIFYANKYLKTVANYTTSYNHLNEHYYNNTLTLTQSLYLKKNLQTEISFKEQSNKSDHKNYVSIALKYLF